MQNLTLVIPAKHDSISKIVKTADNVEGIFFLKIFKLDNLFIIGLPIKDKIDPIIISHIK